MSKNNDQSANEIVEYMTLDSIAQGVPETLEYILEWVTIADPESDAEYQALQVRSKSAVINKRDISNVLVSLCKSGYVRALITNSEGAITPRVDNDPEIVKMESYYYEISSQGKLRWKELNDKVASWLER